MFSHQDAEAVSSCEEAPVIYLLTSQSSPRTKTKASLGISPARPLIAIVLWFDYVVQNSTGPPEQEAW
jgi:hypothetical protein